MQHVENIVFVSSMQLRIIDVRVNSEIKCLLCLPSRGVAIDSMIEDVLGCRDPAATIFRLSEHLPNINSAQ